MHNGLATNAFKGSLIVQAHEFFQLQVSQWLRSSDQDAADRRAEALQTAVAAKLQMVVIDLAPDDDPHTIFETMNARGTPLLASDLIKNYVVSRNCAGQEDVWGHLDGSWWRTEVGRGRNRRPRIDTLFNYWLAMRTEDEVSAARVFDTFRRIAEPHPIEDVMADVRRDMGNYRRFETGAGYRTREESMFHYRSNVMQMVAFTPALLVLLAAPQDKRLRSLDALESFFIRRMACRSSTRGYGRLAIDLASELQEGCPDHVDRTVADFLKREDADYRNWPDDATLEDALMRLPLYRLLTRGRLRLILEGIEGNLRRASMGEESDSPRNLTIEHVMPQSWGANRPLPDGSDRLAASARRNSLVHTIGNLTLVTGRLNSSLSDAAWENKRKTFGLHSALHLNKTLLAESEGAEWDEDFILARSKRMAKLVAQVWPGPDSPYWDN